MKLSVIVPVYNKAPYIKECFESIFNQTWSDFEVIAVDDRSKDNSLEVLRSLGDPRLRIVQQEQNMGEPGTAQHAMDLAQGEYIIRVDADDICTLDRFERQVGFMDAHPELIASGSAMELFGAEVGVWAYPTGVERCRAELLFGSPIVNGACIMRASGLRNNGLRFEKDWPRVGNDWVFWAHVAMKGGLDNLPEPLLLYRRGEQNSMHGLKPADYRGEPLRLVMQACGLQPTDEDVRLHLMLMGSFKDKPDAATLEQLHAWMERLRAWNTESRVFDQHAFDERLQQAWSRVFFSLTKLDAGLALKQWRMGPQREAGKLAYLAKLTLNRWLGRSQPA